MRAAIDAAMPRPKKIFRARLSFGENRGNYMRGVKQMNDAKLIPVRVWYSNDANDYRDELLTREDFFQIAARVWKYEFL